MLGKAQHPFYLADGKTIATLPELLALLEQMDDLFYQHYVNPYKNDFATWIEHEFHESSLADALRYKSREKAVQILHAWLEEKRAREQEKGLFVPQKESALQQESRHIQKDVAAQATSSSFQEPLKKTRRSFKKKQKLDEQDPIAKELASMEKTLAELESAIEETVPKEKQERVEETSLHDVVKGASQESLVPDASLADASSDESINESSPSSLSNPSSKKKAPKPKSIILEDSLLQKQEIVPLDPHAPEKQEKLSLKKKDEETKGASLEEDKNKNILASDQPSEENTPADELSQSLHVVDFETLEKEEPSFVGSSLQESSEIVSSPVAERFQYLSQRINDLSKKLASQQQRFLDHQREIHILRNALQKKEKELQNYKRNLAKLAEENKSLTTAYVKLKEKEHFLQRLELAAREKIKRASLLFDQLNHLLKQKDLLKEETEVLKKERKSLQKKAAKETHELLRDEISLQEIPHADAELSGVLKKEENELYDLDMMEKTIEQLTERINQHLAEDGLNLRKRKSIK